MSLSLRATNWLNGLTAGTADADGWLAICPLADSAEAEVRAELARLGHATEDRGGLVCVRCPAALLLALRKAKAIAANRAECSERILARWPETKQLSASLGVYPAAECDACAEWIAANIAAENAAADLIDAAVTVAAVAAVTPAWPA